MKEVDIRECWRSIDSVTNSVAITLSTLAAL